jgi:predicted RNase H-like nuclease
MSIKTCFMMPRPVKITGRTSSITNAFVNGVFPCRHPNAEEVTEALRILEPNADDLRCAYCGDRASEWDHLRPLIAGKRPTGYISEIANLVPACGAISRRVVRTGESG